MLYVALALMLLAAGLFVYIFAFGPKLPKEIDAIIQDVMSSTLPELITGQTGYANSNGLKIWYERLSPETQPKGTVLLIISNGGNALDWPSSFVHAFVEAGYDTIRYDHRGTGASDDVANWSRKNPYTIADMATDAVAVLDALEVRQAHVVGLSLGSMVAQEMAINDPDRVLSLTLLSTSGFIGDPDLPGLSSRYLLTTLLKSLPLFRYRLLGGEKNLIKERLAKMLAYIGLEGTDIREVAETVLYDLRKRRGVSIQAMRQHQAAITVSGSRYAKLQTVRVPTLIVHGTADPLIPIEHGKKLVETIPNAQGLWLEGAGHALPFPQMDSVNARILAHLEASSSASGGSET